MSHGTVIRMLLRISCSKLLDINLVRIAFDLNQRWFYCYSVYPLIGINCYTGISAFSENIFLVHNISTSCTMLKFQICFQEIFQIQNHFSARSDPLVLTVTVTWLCMTIPRFVVILLVLEPGGCSRSVRPNIRTYFSCISEHKKPTRWL